MGTLVNHPTHYNKYSVEAVEMARRIWGEEALEVTAEITAFFYRMRAGLKEGVSAEQDFKKEEWWLNHIKDLKTLDQPLKTTVSSSITNIKKSGTAVVNTSKNSKF